jgi:quinol-cytochrome oxidoreductase complex cytochrome b subunit
MAILYLFPVIDQSISGINVFSSYYRIIFWFFALNFGYLGFLGSQTAEYPCVELGLFCTVIHLIYCLVYLNIIKALDHTIIKL